MEAKLGEKDQHLYGPVVSDLKAVGKNKNSLEWDLNDWRWDGDLLRAFPSRPCLPPTTITCSSSSVSDHNHNDKEKRRRALLVDDNHRQHLNLEDEDEAEAEAEASHSYSLNLKLGGDHDHDHDHEDYLKLKTLKKTKTTTTTTATAPAPSCCNRNRVFCQVEDCRADLTTAKDYHRRHKVCDLHSKSTKALVGNIMQRFCQQCSRFHLLQEFDQGKRSCRRRLAGHNRRRRKTHPTATATATDALLNVNDQRATTSYLLISLLRILSNMHSNSSDQMRDQDLLSHLLKSLANIAGTVDGRNISALLQGQRSQPSINAATSVEALQKPSDGPEFSRRFDSASKSINVESPSMSARQCLTVSAALDMAHTRISLLDTNGASVQALSAPGSTNPHHLIDSTPEPDTTPGAVKFHNNIIDLNNTYDDSHDHVENSANSLLPQTSITVSLDNPICIQRDLLKSSPPQPSRNSDSTFTQSPSSSSGEAQSRTDRIVFKLFGKDPSDLPCLLRTQILNWLSHSPTDIESYIRPGCIILTIYLHLEKSTWEELYCDLGSSLKRLLDASNDSLWRTGWVYSRVQNCVAFSYNGQLVLDTPLPLKSYNSCRISSIKPVAVALSERAQFVVKGFNLFRPSMRLLCALDGKYLVQDICYELMDSTDTTIEREEKQCLRFSCSIPSVTGRGFIEVEDHGLSSSFFPFIVAEPEVCSEICTLESTIEVVETVGNVQREPDTMEAKNQALDFIHEMGWLLHRCHVKFRLGHMDPNSDLFPFRRFRWLMEFSMDHDWCFVVKKLLSILFEGTVDAGEHSSVEVAILDMDLLHRAVRRNCRPMVELLLKFIPQKFMDKPGLEQSQQVDKGYHSFLFKPDHVGPMGLTPLHVAANQDGCDSVLDALTDDPGKVGIEVWKNAKDETGLTPNDYACLRGHYSYIHLVQRKTSKGPERGYVAVDIPGSVLDYNKQQKRTDGHKTSKVASLEMDKLETKAMRQNCRACQQKLAYGKRSSLVYRPAMLSMVAIAAVCVCVALLFKSSPEVLYVFQPFTWERLKYGSS